MADNETFTTTHILFEYEKNRFLFNMAYVRSCDNAGAGR